MTLQRDDLKSIRQRKYLAKDFDALRGNLLEYARLYYPDKLRDFSENSLGGLLLDMCAYVGDNMSFYLDHQFGELDPTTAVEQVNIQRQLNAAGVPIVGASPALCPVTVYIEVPAAVINNVPGPNPDALPIVKANSTFAANNGVIFALLEDLDYTKTNSNGQLQVIASGMTKIGQKASNGTPQTYILAMTGLCISGQETTENILIGSAFIPFNKILLVQPDVSQIISINDLLGNIYYEVDALSNDTVYQNVLNTAADNDLVPQVIKVIPAPYRYTADVDLLSRRTSLTFGGGNADSLADDVIPDPSSFAISFPYTTTFSRISVNPQQLLQSTTLGVASANTTYQITYRYGGGLSHNVGAGAIQSVRFLNLIFPGNPTAAVAAGVKSSLSLTNKVAASGGEDAPTSDDLKALIPSIRNSQERIVTREDLLARVYTIPANFGRIFRASVRSNPNNPLATQLYVISRNPNGQLITSPDTLKQNLVKYLNPYRMISDAIDILDARIVDLQVTCDVLIDPSLNRTIVIQNIINVLAAFFSIQNFQIDQPLVIDNVRNAIFGIPGVVSINNLKFVNVQGTVNNMQYSNVSFDVEASTHHNIMFPPAGGIFEVRYPSVDIIGKASI